MAIEQGCHGLGVRHSVGAWRRHTRPFWRGLQLNAVCHWHFGGVKTKRELRVGHVVLSSGNLLKRALHRTPRSKLEASHMNCNIVRMPIEKEIQFIFSVA
jgi:hypothetical protein